jgi:F420-non-reducing hydrogenase small subunit
MTHGNEIFGSFFEKGTVVFREGDLGELMYIIQSGGVEISQLQEGREVVLALLERGDFFGEMALVDQRPRSATVTTIQPTRLLPLSRSSFLERISQDPGVAFHLFKSLSRRVEQATHLLRDKVEGDESLRLALECRREEIVSEESLSCSEGSGPMATSEEDSLPTGYVVQVDDLSIDREGSLTFEAGQTIFSEGDPGDALYIISEGSVEIFQDSAGGKCVLARLGSRDIFGEIALLTEGPRTATAVATERTRLFPVKRTEFLHRVKDEPELALLILQVLIMRLRRIHQAMVEPEKSMIALRRVLPPLVKQEGLAKVAIVSLSTCGGCAATFLEDQNELASLLERIRITYCPMLVDYDQIADEVDVAVVDGVVRVRKDEEKLKEARQKSRYLVAWGTCAALGGIPTLANQYELEEVIEASYSQTQDTFDYYFSGTHSNRQSAYQSEDMTLLRKASKLADFVRVDYYLPGCPPQPRWLNQLLKELRGESQLEKPRQIVCVECDRKPSKVDVETLWVFPKSEWDPANCFSSGGAPCLGFLTRGGCGAVCPSNGLPCWGCRGLSEKTLRKVGEGDSFEQVLYGFLARRSRVDEKDINTVMRILRSRGSSLLNFNHESILERTKLR